MKTAPPDGNRMRVWITKWWSTKGILHEDVEVSRGSRYVHSRGHSFRIGFEAFVTREDAVERVRELANCKLAALDREKKKIRETLAGLEDSRPEEPETTGPVLGIGGPSRHPSSTTGSARS